MMVTAVPYESDLLVKPTLVGWCPHCNYVDDPYVKNTPCHGDHDYRWDPKHPFMRPGYTPRFLKRRMWKCLNCDMYFLTRVLLLNHEHSWI